jgi:hypothetical protein
MFYYSITSGASRGRSYAIRGKQLGGRFAHKQKKKVSVVDDNMEGDLAGLHADESASPAGFFLNQYNHFYRF